MWKRRTALALCAMLLLGLCGCNLYTPAPERAMEGLLDALQRGKVRTAEARTVEGTLNISANGRNAEKIYSPLFGSIAYSVTGSVTAGTGSQVTVTMVVVDMEEIAADVAADLLQEVLSQNLSDRQAADRYYKLLLERLEADNPPTVGYTVTAEMVKTDGRWKVDLGASPDFVEAITGGMPSLVGH